jgi:large subunit ribosomal protein L21
MYAIVEVAGKQYKVEEGRYLDVDLLGLAEGEDFTIDEVLLLGEGMKIEVGSPSIEGASVEAKVLKNVKDKKVIVYKQRPKKGYRLKQGHRQKYSRILIKKIQKAA